MKNQKGNTLVAIIYLLVFIFGLWGWGANIYKLAHLNWDAPLNIMSVIRIVGVPVVPVGVVMGYIG